MNTAFRLFALLCVGVAPCAASEGSAAPLPVSNAARADRRYEEMLSRMQSSVEEIAQLYGNPTFLEIFTNDVARASELKERLRTEKSTREIEKQIRELTNKRAAVVDDIALKEREASRLSKKLAVQRAALDAVSGAISKARDAVEETSK